MLSVKLHMDVFPLIGYDVFIVHRKNSHGVVQEGVASPVLVIACEQVCQQLHFRFFAVSEQGYQLVIHLASGGHIQSYGPDGYTGGIDDMGCFRVAENVPLIVMHIVCAAHHHDFLDFPLNLRVLAKQDPHIGQRAYGDQGYVPL